MSFNALTATPLAHLHKRQMWPGHASSLIDGISLRTLAKRLDFDLTTAFRWRHRFLLWPKAIKAKKVQGTVEADRTIDRSSFVGALAHHRRSADADDFCGHGLMRRRCFGRCW